MSIDNQVKTVLLLGVLTGILLWIGSFWGTQGLTFALIFVFIMNFGSYFFSDKIVLMMYRGKEITDTSHRLYMMVDEVRSIVNLPMPKVYVLPGSYSNAFATGRNPKKSAVACSEGIMELLNDHELKGVVAHEIAHIKNRDILISTIAATIAGVISYVAFMARWGAILGGFGGRDKDGGGILELLVLAIVTPLIATLLRLAISRSREFVADATAAKILNDSTGLASALQKLENDIKRKPMKVSASTETTAHMFIANPFRNSGFVRIFMTHPPTKSRLDALSKLQF
jgi:heat shock protein HtpX